jgi:predicted amidophosphoribosyltransferase
MNCRTCGAPLPPEAKMCPNCGTPVSASTFYPGELPYGSGTVPYPYGSQSSSSPSSLCLHFWKGKWQERTPCGIKKNNNA